MTEADRVHSTPPLNASVVQHSNPPPTPRAESPDSFRPETGIDHPVTATLLSESHKPAEGLSRRHALAALAVLPAALPVTAAAIPPADDFELVALGAQFEPLLDRYYAVRAVWAGAMVRSRDEHDQRFGEAKDRGYRDTPEIQAAWHEIAERTGLRESNARHSAIWEEMEPIADAINALPVNSLAGLRTKALVALWEVAPLCADDREYHFGDAHPFQNLFSAVTEFCGLTDKVEGMGFAMPPILQVDDEEED